MTSDEIKSRLPYSEPFLFVDEIIQINENGVTGTYFYDKSHSFYNGHFIDNPVTPGVILTETMAQIGVVCLGIYLLNNELNKNTLISLASTDIEFLKPVFPGETVTVYSIKKYFRFGKLKCEVRMTNESGLTVCEGTISGMIKNYE